MSDVDARSTGGGKRRMATRSWEKITAAKGIKPLGSFRGKRASYFQVHFQFFFCLYFRLFFCLVRTVGD